MSTAEVKENTSAQRRAEVLEREAGHVVATDVSLEDYMAAYAEARTEWLDGVVISMSPIHEQHDRLTYFLRQLFAAYFELRPAGTVRSQPFVLRLPAVPDHRREPDLMVVLETNPHRLTETFMDGPPDLCIEVVSQESTQRDYGDKFAEYEQGGVPEYWIVDPLRGQCSFYRLDGERYSRIEPDAEGVYRTPALPGLALPLSLLWQESLPGPGATAEMVRGMLAEQRE